MKRRTGGRRIERRPSTLTIEDRCVGHGVIPGGSGSAGGRVGKDLARQLNARVEAATGAADLRFLVPASLFIGGLLRLIASKRLIGPAWYDLLWFAFGTYFTLNRDRASRRPGASGSSPGPGPELESRAPDGSIDPAGP
jgi:hypothetical protein